MRTGGAGAGDGLASAGDCVKADGGLASDGWLKAEGELIPRGSTAARRDALGDGELAPEDWLKGDGEGPDGWARTVRSGGGWRGWGWKRGCRAVSGQA